MLANRKRDIQGRRKWLQNLHVKRWHRLMTLAGKCRQCGGLRGINPKTGKLFYLCPLCHAKYLANMAAWRGKQRAAKNGVDLPAA